MDGPILIRVDWVVAALAPGAIAPHPNFSVASVEPVELAALITDGRFADYRRFREGESVVSGDTLSMKLIEALLDSLVAGKQAQGAHSLVELASERALPLGARTSAALFACVAQSELDQLEGSIGVLNQVLEASEAFDQEKVVQEQAVRAGSLRLIQAVLHQQRALRLVELDRDAEAFEAASAALEIAPRANDPYETFPTSKGAGYSSRRAQLDVVAAVKGHALAILSTLEGLSGRLWVRVVKTRRPYVESRQDQKVADAGEALIKADFDDNLASITSRRTFAMGDPIEGPLSTTLLHAELSGDLGGVRHGRGTLGRARVLRGTDRVWSLAEGIRLLRQAGDRQPLDDLLRYVRASGPIEVLQEAAKAILSKSRQISGVTRQDVSVLAAAADVLEEGELTEAIDAVERYRKHPSGRLVRESSAVWVPTEVAWRALAHLVPASDQDQRVARSVRNSLEALSNRAPVGSALSDVVAAVDWENVGSDERQAWINVVGEGAGAADFLVDSSILDSIEGVGRHSETLQRPGGLELGARILFEKSHGIEAPDDEVDLVAQVCIERLADIQRSASRGSYGFGGISAPDLAASLISQFSREDLWSPLVRLLVDPKVSQGDKDPALDRLAYDFVELPPFVLSELRPESIGLFEGRGVDPFESDQPLPASGPALRFLASHGILDSATVMRLIAELGGSRQHRGRVEAARSIAIISGRGRDGEWMGSLLLQLSYDKDAVVRGEAGRAIGEGYRRLGSAAAPLADRAVSLLAEDGILVPLLVLRGLGRAGDIDGALVSSVRHQSEAHPARSVREAARRVINASN